eukprot:20407-Heterococcus_DN1.PRE.2
MTTAAAGIALSLPVEHCTGTSDVGELISQITWLAGVSTDHRLLCVRDSAAMRHHLAFQLPSIVTDTYKHSAYELMVLRLMRL